MSYPAQNLQLVDNRRNELLQDVCGSKKQHLDGMNVYMVSNGHTRATQVNARFSDNCKYDQ